jgi:hypothetical protein
MCFSADCQGSVRNGSRVSTIVGHRGTCLSSCCFDTAFGNLWEALMGGSHKIIAGIQF